MDLIAAVIYLLCGIGLCIWVSRKPKRFPGTLVFAAVFSAGLMFRGYCLVDEYLAGCAVLGMLLALWHKKASASAPVRSGMERLHMAVFTAMCGYMILQSFRGMMELRDARIFRWILYYALLMIMPFIFECDSEDRARRTAAGMLYGAAIYFFLYLAFGIFNEFRGINRFATQGSQWSGSAYAMFPLVISLPLALYFIKAGKHRITAYGIFALVTMSSFYYDSRAGLLAILLFLALSPTVVKVRHAAKLAALTLAIAVLFNFNTRLEAMAQRAQDYGRMIEGMRTIVTNPRESDRDRWVHLRAAASMITGAKGKEAATALFGKGMYAHHREFGPILKPFYDKYLPGCKLGNVTRTEAMSALIVDTGLIGLAFIFLNCLICAGYVFTCPFLPRTGLYLLLGALVLTFLWMTISNILDIVLFYLLIMPHGLIAGMSRLDWNGRGKRTL